MPYSRQTCKYCRVLPMVYLRRSCVLTCLLPVQLHKPDNTLFQLGDDSGIWDFFDTQSADLFSWRWYCFFTHWTLNSEHYTLDTVHWTLSCATDILKKYWSDRGQHTLCFKWLHGTRSNNTRFYYSISPLCSGYSCATFTLYLNYMISIIYRYSLLYIIYRVIPHNL